MMPDSEKKSIKNIMEYQKRFIKLRLMICTQEQNNQLSCRKQHRSKMGSFMYGHPHINAMFLRNIEGAENISRIACPYEVE